MNWETRLFDVAKVLQNLVTVKLWSRNSDACLNVCKQIVQPSLVCLLLVYNMVFIWLKECAGVPDKIHTK